MAIQTPEKITDFPLTLVQNMIGLATSGFGVVVALAWNQAIQKAVEVYITPYLGKDSGVISLLIYAVFMTVLAVAVTMQLTSVEKSLLLLQQKMLNRKKTTNPKVA